MSFYILHIPTGEYVKSIQYTFDRLYLHNSNRYHTLMTDTEYFLGAISPTLFTQIESYNKVVYFFSFVFGFSKEEFEPIFKP